MGDVNEGKQDCGTRSNVVRQGGLWSDSRKARLLNGVSRRREAGDLLGNDVLYFF